MTGVPPQLVSVMERAAGRVFPAAVLRVAVHHGPRWTIAVHGPGMQRHLPCGVDTFFDLASLTKPLVVGTLCWTLAAQGRLDLGASLPRLECPQRRHEAHTADVAWRDLLAHRGGLVAWRPLFAMAPVWQWRHPRHRARLRAAFRGAVLCESREGSPGRRAVYSDLGYLWLGWALEKRLERPLAALWRDECAASSREGLRWWPVPSRECAPTRTWSAWRGRVVPGEVDDDNAWAWGEPTGHAGLFGTASGVGRWAETMLAHYLDESSTLGAVLRLAWHRPLRGSTWRMGMDGPTYPRSTGGRRISPHSVGHLGFTGCSVWLDLVRRTSVVLLTNRTWPDRSNQEIRRFRTVLHDAIWRTVDERHGAPQRQ